MLDDDYPDYYTSPEPSDSDARPATPQAQQPAQPQPAAASDQPRVIDFTGANPSAQPGAPADPAAPSTDEPAEPRRHPKRTLFWVITVVVLVLAAIGYVRYLRPYVDDAAMTVRIDNVERRGFIFKTYEAEVTDCQNGLRMVVSVPDEKLALKMQRVQGTDSLYRLHFSRYKRALPWKGESRMTANYITLESPTY